MLAYTSDSLKPHPMQQLPVYIPVVFGATTLASLILFLLAVGKARCARAGTLARYALWALAGWLALTGVLPWKGFFTDFGARPPHMIFAVAPPFLTVLL